VSSKLREREKRDLRRWESVKEEMRSEMLRGEEERRALQAAEVLELTLSIRVFRWMRPVLPAEVISTGFAFSSTA
jgi:hypothetical protein